MIVGIVATLTTLVLAALGVALWRSARAGTGVWWPLVVAALVLGGLCFAAVRLGFT
ncbi:MAG: hypothetical protein JWN36_463 [Microbacteriaceae bacterium]|nr:hypothetical protein [Microbacteriaceae bacterium]